MSKSTARILIVEDELIVATDLARQLIGLGFTIIGTVTSGEEALALLEKHPTDLALLDIKLSSEIDGIELARIIRTRFALPVIFLTAFSGEHLVERALQTEPYGYLLKPFDRRELQLVIKLALQRHHAETALRRQEEQLKSVLLASMDGFWLIAADGRFLDVNNAACHLSGYTRDELLTMDVGLLEYDRTPAQTSEGIARIFREGAVQIERKFKCKDGTIKLIELSITSTSDPTPRLYCFGRDITERRATEKRLQLLHCAVEQSPVSIVITDPKGDIEYVNPYFEKNTGYTAAEVHGQNPRVLKSLEHSAEFYQQLWETITAGRDWRGEFLNRRKNETLFWEQATISPVRDEQGRIAHFVAVKEDISERKKAERELLRAKEEAETANRAKSAFLATMSHELRTPLNVINGLAAILDGGQSSEEQRNLVKLIASAGHNLLEIIEEILDYSGLQAGKAQLDEMPFSPTAIVGNALRLCAESARTKGLKLSCWIDPKMPAEAIGDARRIQQVLINLLHNALKFTEHGRVHLRVATRRAPAGQHSFEFTVYDSGIGITRENLEKLFRPFSQGDASITRRFGGTGLGLAIAKSYVNLMGGEIRARSRPGQGSTFRFQIRLQASARLETAFENLAHPIFADRTVLIVGDGGAQQRMIEELALLWGMKPTSLRRPPLPDADLTPGDTYDIAILDPDLAGQDGSALANWLAQPGRGDQVPTIWVGRTDAPLPAASTAPHVRFGSFVDPAELSRALASLLRTEPDRAQTAATPAKRSLLGDTIPLSILAAEDNRTNREVIKLIFQYLGYKVETVENGAEAVAAAQRKKYHFVFLDMQMPVMDGLTAAREICRLFPDRGSRPKLVALTANALPGDRESCLDAGMDDYLTKPVVPHDLEICIRKYFDRSKGKTNPAIPAPTVRSTAAPPLLDRAHVETITLGVPPSQAIASLRQLHTSVCTDYRDQVPRVAELCAQREQAAFAQTIHGLKGCFMMVGWTRLGRRCAEALALARKGDFTAWESFPDELDRLFEASSAEMAHYLDQRDREAQATATMAPPVPPTETSN